MTSLKLRFDMPTCDPSNMDTCKERFFPLILTLETLTNVNQWHYRHGRAISIIDAVNSGLHYRPEEPGQEDWDDCLTVAKRGWGDCEDLAAWLCAELREVYGIAAECVIQYQFIPSDEMRRNGYPKRHIPDDGVFLVHVLVRLPNGTILDPSKWLGMRGDFQ